MNQLITKTISLVLLSVAAAGTNAQNQATTLARLARGADAVAVATVTAAAAPTPELLQLTLRVDDALHGQLPTSFELVEPAGRCCGRSLFALGVGDTRLVFLRRVGPTLHVLGAGRGVLPATAALRAHVAALLATNDDPALVHLLAANLEHSEPRIADDAAHALAALPQVALDAAERSALLRALSLSVRRGAPRAAALADVAVRIADAGLVDELLPLYLDAAREDQARLMRTALLRCDAGLVAGRMPTFVGRSRRGQLRAATLLARMPSAPALAAMTNLLQRPGHPQVQLQLCEGLLDAGIHRAALAPLVPDVVLELAERRRDRRPSFRHVRPAR